MSGRIRTLKPELLEDERTAGLSDGAFRLFVGMILLADDYGNLGAHSKRLCAAVFWNSRESRECSREIRECVEAGLLRLYEVNGQRFAHLTGWKKHQRVDRPGKPRVPGPEHGENVEVLTDSRESRESVANVSREFHGDPAPDPDPDHDPDPDVYAASQGEAPPPGPESKPKRSRKKPATHAPPSDADPSVVAVWAAKWDIPQEHPKFSEFVDWHRANGKARADWKAAWRNWTKPKDWEQRSGTRQLRAVQPVDETAPWLRAFDGGKNG